MTGGKNAVTITDANFATEIAGHQGIAMVDFGADWCAPCRAIAPIVEMIAGEYAGSVKVGTLDADANPDTTVRFGVRGLPSVLFFQNGKLVDTVVGAAPKQAYVQKIEQLIKADHAGRV